MIDLLMVRENAPAYICLFLSRIFDCSAERIKIYTIEDFNSLNEELDDSSFECVCVFFAVQGDVAQVLQLYSYKVSDSVVVSRVVEYASKNRIQCYLPGDSENGWIYLGEGDGPKDVQQIECDEDERYLFKLKKQMS